MRKINILLVLGSVRLGRQSHKIAFYLQNLLNQYEGVEAQVLDLLAHPLPMMEERYDTHPDPSLAVRETGEQVKGSDALVFITPEYNGSYSGVLKNAVDHFGRQMSGKPIAVVSTSGGKLGGINASTQLQQLILSIGSYPMPLKLLVPLIHQSFNDQLEPVSPELLQHSGHFVEVFLEFARAVTAKREGKFKSPAPAHSLI